MKNIAFFIFTLAAIALAACSEAIQPEEPTTVQLVAGFVPVHADANGTKAVKSSWEDGDVVFIFFQNVTANSRYLEMRYDNGSWTQTFKNGLTEADLTPDGSKTLTAVYLPFCNDAVPSYTYDGYMGLWHFDKTRLSYYMCADRIPYSVHTANGVATITVSGNTLAMSAPDGFVQFFLDDAAAADGGASLLATGLKPAGLDAIEANGSLHDSYNPVGSALTGYAYKGGYLFSGMLELSFGNVETDYHFKLLQGTSARTATAANKTLQVTGKTGRAVNITRLGWSDSESFAVPMYELNGKIRYFSKTNAGSVSETDAGDYFAWGESEGRQPDAVSGQFFARFNWDGYKWGYDDYYSGVRLHKYCTQPDEWGGDGAEDGKTVLEPADDAATVHLGGLWRTPTSEEWTALTTQCDWRWESDYDGVKGYLVSGRGTFSGNSIFLPAAGRGHDLGIADSDNGHYWSSSLNTGWPEYAINLSFNTGNRSLTRLFERCRGLLVRPVMNE